MIGIDDGASEGRAEGAIELVRLSMLTVTFVACVCATFVG